MDAAPAAAKAAAVSAAAPHPARAAAPHGSSAVAGVATTPVWKVAAARKQIEEESLKEGGVGRVKIAQVGSIAVWGNAIEYNNKKKLDENMQIIQDELNRVTKLSENLSK